MYRFGKVAQAIGISEPALRNWLRRSEVDLFNERPEKGWISFTENDVVVLAVAAELVRFGAPAKQAVEAIRRAFGTVNFKTWEGLADYIYAAPLGDRWVADDREGLVYKMCGPTMLRIMVKRVIVDARDRLRHEES